MMNASIHHSFLISCNYSGQSFIGLILKENTEYFGVYPKELLFLSQLVILTKFAENKWYGYLETVALVHRF